MPSGRRQFRRRRFIREKGADGWLRYCARRTQHGQLRSREPRASGPGAPGSGRSPVPRVGGGRGARGIRHGSRGPGRRGGGGCPGLRPERAPRRLGFRPCPCRSPSFLAPARVGCASGGSARTGDTLPCSRSLAPGPEGRCGRPSRSCLAVPFAVLTK